MKLEFFFFGRKILEKNTQISNFLKIRPVEAKVFHAGRTDMTERIVTFHNFRTAPKNIPDTFNNH